MQLRIITGLLTSRVLWRSWFFVEETPSDGSDIVEEIDGVTGALGRDGAGGYSSVHEQPGVTMPWQRPGVR